MGQRGLFHSASLPFRWIVPAGDGTAQPTNEPGAAFVMPLPARFHARRRPPRGRLADSPSPWRAVPAAQITAQLSSHSISRRREIRLAPRDRNHSRGPLAPEVVGQDRTRIANIRAARPAGVLPALMPVVPRSPSHWQIPQRRHNMATWQSWGSKEFGNWLAQSSRASQAASATDS
jgi:hypothetical protein